MRDAQALANIRQYIRLNPQNYAAVVQGGEPRHLGNRALFERPKVGFLASRGDRLVLGHLKSGGMLECLLSDAPPKLDVRLL